MPLYYVRAACRYEQSHYDRWKDEHEKDPTRYEGYEDYLETKSRTLVADSLEEAKQMFIDSVKLFVKFYDVYLEDWCKGIIIIGKIKDVTISESLGYRGDDYSAVLEDGKKHLQLLYPGIIISSIHIVDQHICDCEP